jgi:hypothetical protein
MEAADHAGKLIISETIRNSEMMAIPVWLAV